MKIYALAFLLLLVTNSCGVIKRKLSGKTKTVEVSENNTSVKKSIVKEDLATLAGVKTTDATNYSDEVTITKGVPGNIELSGNFKLDSSSLNNVDTAFKLIDVTNNGTTLTVYRNGKTNEIRAKVVSRAGVDNVAFSQISMKRTYNNTKTKDSTLQVTKSSMALNLDSVNKDKLRKETKVKEDQKHIETKSLPWVWICLGLLVVAGFLSFKFVPWRKLFV